MRCHVGVTERPGRIAGVALRGEDGHIEALRLGDGSRDQRPISIVDCTGPAATCCAVRWTTGFEDWSD